MWSGWLARPGAARGTTSITKSGTTTRSGTRDGLSGRGMMFSKTKDSESMNGAATPQQQPPVTTVPSPANQPLKRTTRTTGVPSIISAEVVVRGTILSSGDLQVDGKVEGDVRAYSLVVGEKSVVVGDVFAEDAIIRGRVEGSICARKVQLCATC